MGAGMYIKAGIKIAAIGVYTGAYNISIFGLTS